MSYRKADIYVQETKAGVLEESDTGYRFQYDSDYLSQKNSEPVSLTLPFQIAYTFKSDRPDRDLGNSIPPL